MSKRLIYEEDAIDALGEKPLVWDDLNDFDLGKAVQWSDDVDAIKALPSAQPKWIPYEDDTLPEIDEEICVIDIDENVYWTHRTKYSDQLYDPFGNKLKNIVGWFPLPKIKEVKNK